MKMIEHGDVTLALDEDVDDEEVEDDEIRPNDSVLVTGNNCTIFIEALANHFFDHINHFNTRCSSHLLISNGLMFHCSNDGR
jgi:hypothetical protein